MDEKAEVPWGRLDGRIKADVSYFMEFDCPGMFATIATIDSTMIVFIIHHIKNCFTWIDSQHHQPSGNGNQNQWFITLHLLGWLLLTGVGEEAEKGTLHTTGENVHEFHLCGESGMEVPAKVKPEPLHDQQVHFWGKPINTLR